MMSLRIGAMLAALGCAAPAWAAAPFPALSHGGMVASDHVLASEAGATVLANGGNAADAAVATALAAGVVQPAGSGLGGGGFAVIVEPDGTHHVLDFREVAPAKSTRDMYVNATVDNASRIGGLAVGVPGEPAGLVALQERFGKISMAEVVAPAVALAADGFYVGPHLAEALDRLGDAASDMSHSLFGRSEVPSQGDRVRRKRLAHTLASLGKHGASVLQTGPLAADIVAAAAAQGGILSAEDLAAYQPRDREPIVGTYRGWTVITMPPPSSGGVVLLQVLKVLEGLDLADTPAHGAALYHRLAEAMKHAYADRARYMGDPDRIDIPVDTLLAAERIDAIRADFDPERTHSAAHYGTAIDAGTDAGTQHISVIDANGMAVALTTTINTSFGSRVVGPKSGVLLNNEMDDFVARPGVPNHYGLMGSEANAVAPGARPLSSMTPTVLVSPDGQERIVVGASGGPFIISSTLQAIVNVIDFGMDPAEAVSVPRMHHQWAPNVLFVDEGVSPETIEALVAKGHGVQVKDFFSSVQLIHYADGVARGASDPRKGGWPAGEESQRR
jgi:gamma-glutamyltranspeptidase/glutathione hydrolase